MAAGAVGPVGRALAIARRRGITRGLLGDSTFWLVLGGLAWGLRGARRALWPQTPATRQVLRVRPGERIVIRHHPPAGR